MTAYSPQDLQEGWEFKFLRSNTGAFRKREVLQRALEEEGRAGWVLVEKFDHSRLRLKRPAKAKQNDGSLPFDAYRSFYGIGTLRFVLVLLAGIAAVVSLLVVLARAFD